MIHPLYIDKKYTTSYGTHIVNEGLSIYKKIFLNTTVCCRNRPNQNNMWPDRSGLIPFTAESRPSKEEIMDIISQLGIQMLYRETIPTRYVNPITHTWWFDYNSL